ncbi:MAG: GTP-dependent dephospho-CoA kinase family protein [Candidatus Bathyarchaeota archaeon]
MRRINLGLRTRMQERKSEGEQSRGQLIRGSYEETMGALKKLIETEKPPMVIAVGDVVSDNMVKYKIGPQVLVVDNKTTRESFLSVAMDVDQTLNLKNPPQMLADEAWTVMQEAIGSGKKTRILVEGEEDLISIVAVLCAPLGSFVVYGQPQQGIVVVRVSEQRKQGMQRLVDNMERVA